MKKLIVLASLFLITSLLVSQSPFKVDKVTIFTDANAYIHKSGTVSTENGTYEISGDNLPVARFGTLEITDNENTLLHVISSVKPPEVENKSTNATNSKMLLSQNKGISLEIETDTQVILGELIDVYTDHLILKTEKTGKVVMVKIEDINSFTFNSEPTFLKTQTNQNKVNIQLGVRGQDNNKYTVLNLHFSSDGQKDLSLKYLQKGLSWSPMYTLRLVNEKKAGLILQAEIINDAEDLNVTDIHLVLGTPNFKYDEYLTDLIDYNNILDPYFESTHPGSTRNLYLAEYKIPLISRDETISGSKKKEDEQQHDFYIHKLNYISLKKNSRGLFKILDTEVAYRHIFECDLISLDYQNNRNRRNEDDVQNTIYHSILIDNNSDVMFGRGSVLVVDGAQESELPLAQNTLEYIPPRSEGIIKITENHEIQISHKEKIIARSTNKIEFWGRDYFEAKIEGTVTVKNLKSENIEILIRNILHGKLDNIGTKGEIVYQRQPLYSPNYKSKVKWTLQLKPGEEKELIYQYRVLVN